MASVLMFPNPLPDETITSLVARYHQMSGSLGVRRTLADLFGAVTRSYASDLPCFLTHLEAVSGCKDLVDNHTLLPYFEPFLSAVKAKRAKELMQSSYPVGLKLELGITAAGFERFRTRRYCPRCVTADFAVFGVSYWHVGHQAAGVHVCPKHHCYLHHVLAQPRTGDFNQLVLPSDIIGRDDVDAIPPLSKEHFYRLGELADLIEWGRCNRQSMARLLQDDYLHFVIDRAGFISKGRVCARRLEEQFITASITYPSKYEFQRLFELHHGRVVWPLDLLRGRKTSHHPLLFYIFLTCIGIDLLCLVEDCLYRVKYINRPMPLPLIKATNISDFEITSRRQSFSSAYAYIPAKNTGDYAWLYRHDRAWLQSYISYHRKPSVIFDIIDWADRDCKLAGMVLSAVTKLNSMPGPPIQISLAAICRILSVPPDTFRHKHKLPKSMKVIKESLENRHDYQLRKLAWAANVLIAENKNRTKSNLLRKSNIRLCCLTDWEVSRFIS